MMNNDFKELQHNWDTGKKRMDSHTVNFDGLYRKIKTKEKENHFFYYGTLAILMTTLVIISLFFYYIAPVKEIPSRIGVALMILGLLSRIFAEIISLYKAKKINNLDNSLRTTENLLNFHQFRKTIHQVISPVIIGLYSIGFYMISPEFSIYLGFWNVVLIDLSYLVMGIVLFITIRKGVLKEMRILSEIIKLKNEIIE